MGWVLALLFFALVGGEPASPSVSVEAVKIDGDLDPAWSERFDEEVGEGLADASLKRVDDGAQFLVRPIVRVLDGAYALEITVVDATTGDVVASAVDKCELCGLVEAADALRRLSASVRDKLDALQVVPASVALDSDPPGATVLIDGSIAGTTPLQVELPAGRHEIELELHGYEAARRGIVLVDGVREQWGPKLRAVVRRRRPMTIAGAALTGVGIVSTVTGAVFLALHGRDVASRCERDGMGNCRFLFDTQRHGAAFLSTGLGLALVGATLLIIDRKPRKGSTLGLRW